MSLQALPNFPRGSLILDPGFYTSSVFVEPMRKDIQALLEAFVNSYGSSPPPRRVFALFREVWKLRGWEFLHLCAIEDINRDSFLLTVFRLFIERLTQKEPPLVRVGALLGLYTAYLSQPGTELRRQSHIPIPIDTYVSFESLFSKLPVDVSLYTTHVLSKLLDSHVFLVLPESSTSPYNPCNLPHGVVQEIDPLAKKKTGRKNKRDKELIALGNLRSLEAMVASGSKVTGDGGDENFEYLEAKEDLISALPRDVIRNAEHLTLQRLKELSEQHSSTGESEGLRRAEDAMQTGEGLMGLVHSSMEDLVMMEE